MNGSLVVVCVRADSAILACRHAVAQVDGGHHPGVWGEPLWQLERLVSAIDKARTGRPRNPASGLRE